MREIVHTVFQYFKSDSDTLKKLKVAHRRLLLHLRIISGIVKEGDDEVLNTGQAMFNTKKKVRETVSSDRFTEVSNREHLRYYALIIFIKQIAVEFQ